MPTQGNPKLTVRMPDEKRAKVMTAARNSGTDAPTVINALLDWWLGVPGAELPEQCH